MMNLTPSENTILNYLEDLIDRFPDLNEEQKLLDFCASYFYLMDTIEIRERGLNQLNSMEVVGGLENMQEIKELKGMSLSKYLNMFSPYVNKLFMEKEYRRKLKD